MVELGDQVKDSVTGFSGIVTGITGYLNGCRRIIVQPKMKKDGKMPDSSYIDEPQLTVTKKKAVKIKRAAVTKGGPMPEPVDKRDPK